MPRNAEVIRQWKILRTLEASRQGETIAGLARLCEVTERTVWRDVAALQEAGFPLVDEKPNGRTRWKLLPPDPFPNSLGVHTGEPERVEIEFLPEAAVYVRERTWHASDARDGYAPHLDLEFAGTLFDLSDHPRLPFR